MVKLDVTQLRYLSNEEFRVLVAIEMGMKNHHLVPTPLVERVAALRHGGVRKFLDNLLRLKLIHHDAKKYDGYYLNYPGYDYLALKTFMKRGHLSGVGRQIGVGKESDIYCACNEEGDEIVIKFHRLGRTSFRTVKHNRDYLKGRKASNWLYLSRLSALKEFAFMKALHSVGINTPTPIDCNRHGVLMDLIKGYPLYQVKEIAHPRRVMRKCLDIIVNLAEYGLIHGDFNEFNLLVVEKEEMEGGVIEIDIVVIDFPQMVSTSHENADFYFDRDVECIHEFFGKRFAASIDYRPKLSDIQKTNDLDVEVEASGFSKEMAKEFERLLKEENEANQDDEDDEDEDQADQDQDDTFDESKFESNITEEEFEKSADQVTNNHDNDDHEETASVATSTRTTTTRTMRSLKPIDEDAIKHKVKNLLSKRNQPNVMRLAKRNAQKGDRDTRKMKQEIREINKAGEL
ncbi:RIO kinase [Acrasis kona]|uniref:Serine/threonine-protein kinase RIO2 n=1 Tax=Acrasis kona TaxID=1008807 RepID=A0AAW2Z8D5_9EUKA